MFRSSIADAAINLVKIQKEISKQLASLSNNIDLLKDDNFTNNTHQLNKDLSSARSQLVKAVDDYERTKLPDCRILLAMKEKASVPVPLILGRDHYGRVWLNHNPEPGDKIEWYGKSFIFVAGNSISSFEISIGEDVHITAINILYKLAGNEQELRDFLKMTERETTVKPPSWQS